MGMPALSRGVPLVTRLSRKLVLRRLAESTVDHLRKLWREHSRASGHVERVPIHAQTMISLMQIGAAHAGSLTLSTVQSSARAASSRDICE